MAATAHRCQTCRDYELVDGDDGFLTTCPDCARELLRCPVHGQHVMARAGVLLGFCWGCVNEAAAAKAKIERRA